MAGSDHLCPAGRARLGTGLTPFGSGVRYFLVPYVRHRWFGRCALRCEFVKEQSFELAARHVNAFVYKPPEVAGKQIAIAMLGFAPTVDICVGKKQRHHAPDALQAIG